MKIKTSYFNASKDLRLAVSELKIINLKKGLRLLVKD